eukprot:10611026-Alexandrium_andersonii.AAC.1
MDVRNRPVSTSNIRQCTRALPASRARRSPASELAGARGRTGSGSGWAARGITCGSWAPA